VKASELFDLSGKVAIVTGGGTGIGRQMAEGLAEMGADLVLCSRHLDRVQRTAGDLRKLGVRAIGLRCDLRDGREIETVVERTISELGRIDVLVNNSGTAWGAPAEEMPLDGWQKVVDVNLTGTFLFSQAAGRAMIDQGAGKIVNIASVTGLVGSPPEILDSVPYNATKGAILSLTRDLAVKWARHGITVNAIAPGWFPTELTNAVLDRSGDQLRESIPLRRFGSPDDLKGAIVFLASAASDYVTGQTLVVDGGHSAW
jgi:gluconate 5-dehydrogenase